MNRSMESFSILISFLFFFTFLHPSRSRFVVERESLRVIHPQEMKSKHDGAIANFGVPNYGGTLTGNVVFPDKNSAGCEKFDATTSFKSKKSRPNIVLLDRGGCYFALKAWNAQQAGAAAVLVADNIDEPLLTMDSPDENGESENYVENITIPSALIDREFGITLKKALQQGKEVRVQMDWKESLPHEDERVEYELWTNSNDECGTRCNEQMDFVKNFKGHAQILERGAYTLFTPHYITWYCPEPFLETEQCKVQCINNGRYCAPDPEDDFSQGYDGKDVVIENLRQLCVHRVANDSDRSWIWWDYVTDFHIRCSMKNKRFSVECAEDVIDSLGLPLEKIRECMGDPEADAENKVLKTEQELQVGDDTRGDVTILPTLVINNAQYRGKLERTAVLKAICSGFKESTEPRVCLTGDLETNECLERNGGCWQDPKTNISACKDTFRGRICECPVVNGVQYLGDGYKSCEAVGPARCAVNHGGCWSETRKGQAFSACSGTELKGCRCPPGFRGDGYNKCEDVNECAEGVSCSCDGCYCKNKWGGYDCKCSSGFIYIADQDACIANSSSKIAWILTLVALFGVAAIGAAGYIIYKYRLRSYMDSEIMAIMSQYMPLDNQQNEAQPLRESTA